MSTPSRLPDGRIALWSWYLKPLLDEETDASERRRLMVAIKEDQARVRALWREAKRAERDWCRAHPLPDAELSGRVMTKKENRRMGRSPTIDPGNSAISASRRRTVFTMDEIKAKAKDAMDAALDAQVCITDNDGTPRIYLRRRLELEDP